MYTYLGMYAEEVVSNKCKWKKATSPFLEKVAFFIVLITLKFKACYFSLLSHG